MKIFRKSIVFLLAVVLCFGTLCSGSFAEEITVDEETKEAIEVLRMLGAVSDYYDYNTPFGKEISRAEFVDAAARLIGVDNYRSTDVYYYDVPETHYAYNSICALTSMGVVNGTAEKLFEPEEPISDAAAYKILLTLMGYGEIAYHSGGYPTGYVAIAKRTEILVNSTSENVTYSEMLKMLYRATKADALEPVAYSGEGGYTVAEANEGDTLLSIYRNIYFSTGVVSGADCISLNGIELRDTSEVLIDDVKYTSPVPMRDYLGEEIDYYWYDDNVSDGEVIWAKRNGKTDIITLTIDNNANFDKETFVLTYENDEEKNEKITVDRSVLVIFNGGVVDTAIDELFNLSRYTVKLVKTDGKYTIAIIDEYENYTVDTVDIQNKVVFDKLVPQKSLSVDAGEYDYFSIKNIAGTEIAVSEITQGDVLSAYMSKDGNRLEVIVSTDEHSGTVDVLKTKYNGYEVTMGENVYIIPFDVYTDAVAVGKNVKLYVDFCGYAAFVSTEAAGDFAAYLIDMSVETDLVEKVKFKLLREDGSRGVYECAENIRLDGVSRCDAADIKNTFTENGVFKGQIALIQTDNDGLIKSIDTSTVNDLYETVNDSLSENRPKENRLYRSTTGTFGIDCVIDANTVMFGVPSSDMSNITDDMYKIVSKSSLVNDDQKIITTYKVTERTDTDKYVVMELTQDDIVVYDEYALPILVTDIGEGINSQGDVVETIEGYKGAAKVTYYSDGNISFKDANIKPGMLVRAGMTDDGDVGGITINFDYANINSYTTGNPNNALYGVEIGYVSDVVGNVIKFGYTSGEIVERVAPLYTAPVLVWNSADREPAYVGSFENALTYRNSGAECSRVVMITRRLIPLLYVIYV